MRRRRTLSASAELEPNIQAIERRLVTLKKERVVLFDPDGRFVMQKDGYKNYVSFTPDELGMFRGRILTHNHPPQKFKVSPVTGEKEEACGVFYSGGSLSPKDVKVAIENNLMEVRAVTKAYVDGVERTIVHRMQRPAKGWPSWPTFLWFYRPTVRHVNERLRRHLKQGRVQYRDVCTRQFHDVWEEVGRRLDVPYDRVVID